MNRVHTDRTARNLTLGLALLSLLGLIFGLTTLATAQADAPATSVTVPMGTTITVNTDDDDLLGNDNCTLREAILAANTDTAVDLCPGGSGTDTITFAANYTITLGSALPAITNSVTISGNGIANTVVQASACNPVTLPGGCTPADWRVFTVMTATVTMKDLTVRNGNCDGGCTIDSGEGGNIHATAADLTLDSVNVQTGYADTGGGGIYSDGGALTLQNKTVIGGEYAGNKTGDLGAGVYMYNGSDLLVDNSRIAHNHAATYGGGIELRGSSATVQNGSVIDHNKAVGDYGGGIYIEGTGSQLVVDASTISYNSSTSGGGIRIDDTSSRVQIMSGSVVASNTVTSTGIARGGGIYNRGTLTVSKSTVLDNLVSPDQSGFGGGVYNHMDGALIVLGSTFSGNTASGFPSSWGGGIYNDGTLEVTNSTLSGNAASGTNYGYGGGIGSYNGTIDIAGSTFTDNSASGAIEGSGGGISHDGIPVTVTNSTFYSNSATYRGGGVHQYDGTLHVLNTTFSGNSSDPAMGAGIDIEGGDLSLANSILANSLSGYDCSSSNALSTDINNLIESNNGCGTPVATTDPKLGVLAGNGGDTETMALLSGSPAIDAANDAACPAADQRGITRPQGEHCDIGAFELDAIPLSVAISGSGSGTVTSSPPGIDCGADCSEIFDYGTVVTLTATADMDSTFAGWSGDCTGEGNCVVITNATKNITATFTQQPDYTVYLPFVTR